MRITFFIGSMQGGGAERVISELSNYFCSVGHEVRILIFEEGESVYPLDNRVKLEFLHLKEECRKGKLQLYLSRMHRLKTYIKKSQTDVFIVFTDMPIIMFLLNGKASKVPIIISERNSPQKYRKWEQHLLKVLVKRTHGIVFQTKEALKWYKPYINNNIKTWIIPNPISTSFLDHPIETKKENRLVAVGRLSEQKNYPLLIEAFSDIADQIPDYTLDIYGIGEDETRLKNMVNSLNIQNRVLFHGFSKNIIKDIFKAKLYIMTSNFEGMPNSLMEALALGIPSISTDCPAGGPRELIKHNQNGVLINMNDKEALKNEIIRIIYDDELQWQFSNNSKETMAAFHPSKIGTIWLNAINELVK